MSQYQNTAGERLDIRYELPKPLTKA